MVGHEHLIPHRLVDRSLLLLVHPSSTPWGAPRPARPAVDAQPCRRACSPVGAVPRGAMSMNRGGQYGWLAGIPPGAGRTGPVWLVARRPGGGRAPAADDRA